MRKRLLLIMLMLASPAMAETDQSADFRKDALSIEPLINLNYAYLERFAGGRMPMSARLREEAERVSDQPSLLRFAERALLALADHHAITGASLAESWAVVPSYSDVQIDEEPPLCRWGRSRANSRRCSRHSGRR